MSRFNKVKYFVDTIFSRYFPGLDRNRRRENESSNVGNVSRSQIREADSLWLCCNGTTKVDAYKYFGYGFLYADLLYGCILIIINMWVIWIISLPMVFVNSLFELFSNMRLEVILSHGAAHN